MQEGRPVAYFSKKFSGAQLNYTTSEKEMLAIVETLKEFCTMLYGTELHIHTDHANLTFKTTTSQRVMRWRAYVEEYAPTLYYIKGEKNILADTFSRLPRLDQEDGKVELTDAYFAEADEFHDLLEDDDLFECFLSLPVMASPGNNPLNYKFIRDQQQACQALATARQRHPHDYIVEELDDNVHSICHVKPGTDPNVNWKIALPDSC